MRNGTRHLRGPLGHLLTELLGPLADILANLGRIVRQIMTQLTRPVRQIVVEMSAAMREITRDLRGFPTCPLASNPDLLRCRVRGLRDGLARTFGARSSAFAMIACVRAGLR